MADVEPAVAPPPGNPRFPNVDAMRALAALAVLAVHAFLFTETVETTWYGAAVINLGAGVQLFFAISAFLLYRPFFAARYLGRPDQRVRTYLGRRVLRIVPAYWLALTLLAIYPGLVGVFTGDWWIYYGFMQIYDTEAFTGGLMQAWSLCVEALFYIVLPVYALAMARVCRGLDRGAMVRAELGVLTGLALASLAWLVLVEANKPLAIPGLFFWFAPGMALAVVSVVLREGRVIWRPAATVARKPWIAWTLSGLAFAALAITSEGERRGAATTTGEILVRDVLLVVVVIFLLIPAVSGTGGAGAIRRMLSWRVLGWLGLVSYGIFLWHFTVIGWLTEHGVGEWLPDHSFAVVATVAFLLTTALAAVSYYVLERPLLRLKYRGGERPEHRVEGHDRESFAQAAP